ncbi:hypothetical protein BH10ACT8_BH10ACT8_12750 [soil metagenome]
MSATVDGPIEPSGAELVPAAVTGSAGLEAAAAQLLVSDELASPIVVGVSRRTGSPDALRWAAAEAQLRHTRVLAVTAWRPPRAPAAAAGRPPVVGSTAPDDAFTVEEQRLRAEVAATLGGDLDLMRVEYGIRRGTPTAVLLAAARTAQLLVLDSPRTGTLSTLGKSWIVPQILAKSPCPVILMPATIGN